MKGSSPTARTMGAHRPLGVSSRAFTLSFSWMSIYWMTCARTPASSTGNAISTRCSVLRVIMSALDR